MIVRFVGSGMGSGSGDCVYVDNMCYRCSEKLQSELAYCTNMKEYAEAVEILAYAVFVSKTRENGGLFY